MTMFDDVKIVQRPAHWHALDHYGGEARLYTVNGAALRSWISRHGGRQIVDVVECDEPQCLAEAGR